MKNYLIIILFLSLVQSISFAAELDLHVSHGRSSRAIVLSWKPLANTLFVILRSDHRNGNFVEITRTVQNSFDDTSCMAGIEYFYKVVPVQDLEKVHNIVPISGYRRIELQGLYSIEQELARKNKPKPSNESSLDITRQSKLQKYYMNWIEVRFFFFVTQPYVNKGAVIILSDLSNFYSSRETNTIIFSPADESYQLTFVSSMPFQLLETTGDRELFDRLIRNGLALCVYQGEMKIKDRQGRNKYVPRLEAIGLFTQYYKYEKNWPHNTILFSTEHEDLVKKMRQNR